MNKKITDIKAEKILDSRSKPTLKVEIFVDNISASFSVPSGASTGRYEAYELRDRDGNMETAIGKIHNLIKPSLIGVDVTDQKKIDNIMINLDGTAQKINLGGNAMIGVSIACAKTAALVMGLETYEYLKSLIDIKPSKNNLYLYFNLINGGKHASSKLTFQEYHVVPVVNDANKKIEICNKIQSSLNNLIISKYKVEPEKGDEGGVALSVEDVTEPLNLLQQVVDNLGYTDELMLAIDVASSSFYNKEKGLYRFMNKDWSRDDMIDFYKDIASKYSIISIEDPLAEEDYEGFALLQKALPKVMIIGDDLTVTNKLRLQKAIDKKSIRGIIIKPNQIGTLSETLETMQIARDNNIDCIVSHRSGETMDDFIADLAYAFNCYGLKSGALGPKERNVKYDRIIKIIKKI